MVAEGAFSEGAAGADAATGAGVEVEVLDLLAFLLFFVCGIERSALRVPIMSIEKCVPLASPIEA